MEGALWRQTPTAIRSERFRDVGDGRSIGRYRARPFFPRVSGRCGLLHSTRKVKITVVSEQGKEAVVALLGTNDFFGEGCLAGQKHRMATVTSMTDAVIARLEKAAVVSVIHQEPAFAEMFIAHLLARTIRVEADLVDQLFNSSEKRLARLLLLPNLATQGARADVSQDH